MFNTSMFICVTSAGDHASTIIHKDKIIVAFPVPAADQLANGKTSIILINGMRVNCTEPFDEVLSVLMPRTN